jgi:hypothetical protein
VPCQSRWRFQREPRASKFCAALQLAVLTPFAHPEAVQMNRSCAQFVRGRGPEASGAELSRLSIHRMSSRTIVLAMSLLRALRVVAIIFSDLPLYATVGVEPYAAR